MQICSGVLCERPQTFLVPDVTSPCWPDSEELVVSDSGTHGFVSRGVGDVSQKKKKKLPWGSSLVSYLSHRHSALRFALCQRA